MTSIATRTGDEGTTSLLYGQRVPKNHPQIEAVGCFDELNSALGFAKSTSTSPTRRAELETIQKELVSLMGEIAVPEDQVARYEASKFTKLDETSLARIDAGVAAIEARQLRFDGWATPGANLHAAALDLARSIGRRAERQLCTVADHGRTVRPMVRQYVNRLCDLLWLMAREAEQERSAG
ncbi:Cob(I)yrinic acid a,c-diamide adenosyltransferase [mine drainage metagenome]|uniref:Cob(I)yrinic acid a,c-diamide adenosyltransferase n=1 Tax=mine drainage metagenome TaxID=410659 RepID=A0A1J5QNF3_9ZZZZ